MGMNNKEFIDLAANIFYGFNKFHFDLYYISIKKIEKDTRYYINMPHFEMKIEPVHTKTVYAEKALDVMEKKGYNRRILDDIDFSQSKYELEEIIKSFDSYCQEHNAYYNKKCGCIICNLTSKVLSKNELKNKKVIYENEFAEHYDLDNEYNIKVYKDKAIDLDQMEERVKDIISRDEKFNKKRFKQDLFIPEKTLLDDNRKFYRSSI